MWKEEDGQLQPQTLGRIASFYYLQHETMAVLADGLQPGMTVPEVPFPHVLNLSCGRGALCSVLDSGLIMSGMGIVAI